MSNMEKTTKAIQSIMDRTKEYYTLNCLTRYNTRQRIKDESVAEHLAFVTLIVLDLHGYYKFNLETAMKMAITHDLPEIHISDVPYTIKARFPDIKKALKEAEDDIWRTKYKRWSDVNFELQKGETIEAVIVELADAMSCYQYSKNEVLLGNDSMQDVLDKSSQRVYAFMERISGYER